MGVKTGGGGIPAEYQRCEWIKSSKSGKYVKTEVRANATTKAEIVLTKPSGSSGPVVISSSGTFPIGAINNSQSVYVCDPQYDSSVAIETPTLLTFTKAVTGNGYVWLFGWNSINWLRILTIYSAKLYQGDTLAFDGVPAYRKSDGMAGLWDFVSEAFCPGTEEYTKGPDVT